MPRSNHLYSVIIIGAFVFLALGFGLYKVDRLSFSHTRLIEASLGIGLEISTAHLHFHEALHERKLQEIEQVWAHVESADRYALAVLEGGRVKGELVPETTDSTCRAIAVNVREDLAHLKASTTAWLEESERDNTLLTGSRECKALFDQPIRNAYRLEGAIKLAVGKELFHFRVVQLVLMALSLVCAGLMIFWIKGINQRLVVSYREIRDSKQALELEIEEKQKLERSLREKERLLSATVESTADGILVVNAEGRTQLVNQNFIDLWNIPEALIEACDDDKMLEYVLDQLNEPHEFLAKVRALYQTEEKDSDTLYFKDGRVISRYSCPLLEEGRNTGRVWSFRDITDQERNEQALRESEQSYRETLKHIRCGIVVHDIDAAILTANPAACQFFGQTEDQLHGRHVTDLGWQFVDRQGNELAPETMPINRIRSSKEPIEPIVMGLKQAPNQEPRWFITNAFGLFDPQEELKRLVMSMVDISSVEKIINANSNSPQGLNTPA